MAQLKSTNVMGNLSATGSILAPKFIKLGSTSNDVLLGDGSVVTLSAQTTAPVNVTTTANRTYKIQKNGDNLVVNVPWETGSSTTGTVTSIAAGTGLKTSITNNGAITTSGTISLDVAATKTALGLASAAYTDSTAYATSTQGSNADTAYGWGNHANAGYTKNEGTVTSITAGTGLSGGTITTTGTITLKNTGVHVISGGNQVVYHCIATGFTKAAVSGNYITLELYCRAGESVKVMISSNDSSCQGRAIRLSDTHSKIKAIGFSASDGKLYVTTDNFPNFLGCRVISCSEDVSTPVMTTVTSRPSGLHEIAILPIFQTGYTASGANLPVQLSSGKAYVALTKSAITSGLGYTPLTDGSQDLAFASGTGWSSLSIGKKSNNGILTLYRGSNSYLNLQVEGTPGAGTALKLPAEGGTVATQGWVSTNYLPLTAGYDKQLTGILYANKPIGIKGTFDNNVIPTDVQGVTYLAYNSSSKSLDFIFN